MAVALLLVSGCAGEVVSPASSDSNPGPAQVPGSAPGTTPPPGTSEDPTTPPDGTPNEQKVDLFPDLPEVSPRAGLNRLSNHTLLAAFSQWSQELGVSMPNGLAEALPAEEEVRGYSNNGAALSLQPALFEAWFDVAERVAPTWVAPLLDGCTGDNASCTESMLQSAGRLVFRRPLNDTELAGFVSVYNEVRTLSSVEEGRAAALAAILVSPDTLYRIEVAQTDRPATDFELATRLAGYLWGSVPDRALLDAAEAGRLSNPATRRAEVERMVEDPRTSEGLAWFFDQWLELDEILEAAKDPDIYPNWDNDNPRDMLVELEELLVYLTMSGERGRWSDIFSTTDFVPVDSLAGYYDLPPSSVPVSVESTPRRGLLTRGGILARHGFQQTSPVLRGYWVRERILCDEVPEAPDNVDNVPPPLDELNTTRQRIEARTSGSCAGCHALMNGLGFAFEGFDSTGMPRTMDNGFPVDTTGEAVFSDLESFDGLAQLQSQLTQSQLAKTCFVRQLFRYGIGRLEDGSDVASIESLRDLMDGNHGELRSIIMAMTDTPAFTTVTAP